MIFCGRCGTQRGYPMSSMRTSKGPCEICGGHDKMNVRQRDRTIERPLPNYSYPTNLLPTPVEVGERDD